MNKESREVLDSVRRLYLRAHNSSDRLVVKWIGWLGVFLSMDTEARIKFASNELEVDLTKKQLIKELYGIREEKKRGTTTNKRRTRDSSEGIGRIL